MEGKDGKSGKPVLMMGALLEHSHDTMPPNTNDAGQAPTMVENPVLLDASQDNAVDSSIAEWGADWDFWETADWARTVETVCYSSKPTEEELLHCTAILNTGASTSVTSVSWVKQWDVDFLRRLSSSEKTLRFGPGKPLPSIGT